MKGGMLMKRSLGLNVLGLMVAFLASGCTVTGVNFSEISRPQRSEKMDAYSVFVGSWTWEAEMINADAADRHWTGTAEWKWGLDQRVLNGHLAAKSQRAEFEADGVWSWHPEKKKYVWWMFSNWGYPQSGTAKYDADRRCWRMDFKSVGLDGTDSYGCYCLCVKDNDTIDWNVCEYADPFRTIKKMEMNGTYKRKR